MQSLGTKNIIEDPETDSQSVGETSDKENLPQVPLEDGLDVDEDLDLIAGSGGDVMKTLKKVGNYENKLLDICKCCYPFVDIKHKYHYLFCHLLGFIF